MADDSKPSDKKPAKKAASKKAAKPVSNPENNSESIPLVPLRDAVSYTHLTLPTNREV